MGIYCGVLAALECRRLDAAFSRRWNRPPAYLSALIPGHGKRMIRGRGGSAAGESGVEPPHSKDAAHRYTENRIFKLTRRPAGEAAGFAATDTKTGNSHVLGSWCSRCGRFPPVYSLSNQALNVRRSGTLGIRANEGKTNVEHSTSNVERRSKNPPVWSFYQSEIKWGYHSRSFAFISG